MSEKQLQVLSSFSAAKMTNSKYVNQKKKLESELKAFRDYFNYDRRANPLLLQEN